MKTVNDLIKALQKLNAQQKSLPFVVYDTEHNQEFDLQSVDPTGNDRIQLNLKF